MSWTEAEQFYRTLRAVEAELDADPHASPRWEPRYAELFGSPVRLRLALLTRWRTIVEAQGEDVCTAELADAHPGLARLAGVPRSRTSFETLLVAS